MKFRRIISFILLLLLIEITVKSQTANSIPDTLSFVPFIWPNEIPKDCPFKYSNEFNIINLLGMGSGYHFGDTLASN
jgi:hypothetical protein